MNSSRKVEAMSTSLLPTNASLAIPFDRPTPRPAQSAVLLALEPRAQHEESRNGRTGRDPAARRRDTPRPVHPAVDISPSHLVGRRAVTLHGMTVETVQAKNLDRMEFRFRAPMHLLVVCERAVRREGDTFVEGLPRSTLRDLTRKLTFVPAEHEYREWQDPRILTRLTYFYFEPGRLPVEEELDSARKPLTPRLFFEDQALSCTASKLQALIENPDTSNQLYFEALAVVLAHELTGLNGGTPNVKSPVRGGLAAWQQRIVADYIEENLAQQIPLATLAGLVRLSPHYFCRAFKQSFRVPPHHYHSSRRIEHAKILLARPTCSVTEIGLALGFSTTSSFTAAFRKAAGRTPTEYRRSLV
jgi:AraC family transcriptional regulator